MSSSRRYEPGVSAWIAEGAGGPEEQRGLQGLRISFSPLGHPPQVRTIRQTIAKLENKVRELEKQQVTILATPLPEESE